MKNNNRDSFLTFKVDSKVSKDKLNNETLESTIKDIVIITKKITETRDEIEQCKTIDQLNKINIDSISSDMSLIVQNSILINDFDTRMSIEELNQTYHSTEILYFNKKIDLLKKDISKTAEESEKNIKDITGGTLFSIASVFLGISLTSSLVTGVLNMNSSFTILYYMTCLLIAVITIGTAAIFMRKYDDKSKTIMIIIVLISIIWGIVAFKTIPESDNKKCEQVTNTQENINNKDQNEQDNLINKINEKVINENQQK